MRWPAHGSQDVNAASESRGGQVATRRPEGPLPFVPGVTPSHPIPVRSQIAAGLESAIRDRFLEPGAVLPSTRVLAGRLGVHRNTVAASYRLLRDRGLTTGGLGAPMRVGSAAVPLPVSATGSGLAARAGSHPGPAARLMREMTIRARSEGVSRRELVRQMGPWLADGLATRLCLVEPRTGLRAVLHAELRRRLPVAVVAGGWQVIRTESTRTDEAWPDGTRTDGALIVGRPEIVGRIEERFQGVHAVQPLILGGGSGALARARAIRRPGVVALLTRSSLIRRFARELAAGYHGSGLSLALPDPGDPFALRRAARIARLILADASCRGMRLETRARVCTLNVLSEPTIRALLWHLGGTKGG